MISTSLRPNKIGFAFLALAATMLVAALNYGNNLIFFISFLFISLLINSSWQTWRSLASAEISGGFIPPHFADEAGQSTLRVRANLPNPAVTIWLDGHMAGQIGWTAGDSQHTLIHPLLARGVYPSPTWILVSRYPLGLWTATRTLPAAPSAHWVYPERRGSLPLPDAPASPDAGAPISRPDQDEEFDHLRAYQPGDAHSRIAFKSYARTGQLVTQHWTGQRRTANGGFLLDFTAVPGDTEQRLSQISAWIDWLSADNRSFILRLPGAPDLIGHDAAHRLACWQALAGFPSRWQGG